MENYLYIYLIIGIVALSGLAAYVKGFIGGLIKDIEMLKSSILILQKAVLQMQDKEIDRSIIGKDKE